MNYNNRINILTIFLNTYGSLTTELNFSSEFELLVAVLLSAKTTDRMVNIVTKKLFSIANTPKGLILAGLPMIKKSIKRIGLFNRKSINIFKICNILLKKYNGKIPRNRKDLESLPGIGRKTANVILNVVFNKKTIAVDTHVFRVCNRTGFATGKTVFEVEKKLLDFVPSNFKLKCHFLFLMHGRHICTFYKPKCLKCCISHDCEFKNKV